MERGIQSMSDAHGLCLQDFVTAGTNNGTTNDHLHNHHNLHDSVSSAVSVSSAITGLMSSGNNSLNHLSHDTSNHHHHHHHSLSNTPALHEPLEKLKCKCSKYFDRFVVFRPKFNFPWHCRQNETKRTSIRFGFLLWVEILFALLLFHAYRILLLCFAFVSWAMPKVKREIFPRSCGWWDVDVCMHDLNCRTSEPQFIGINGKGICVCETNFDRTEKAGNIITELQCIWTYESSVIISSSHTHGRTNALVSFDTPKQFCLWNNKHTFQSKTNIFDLNLASTTFVARFWIVCASIWQVLWK